MLTLLTLLTLASDPRLFIDAPFIKWLGDSVVVDQHTADVPKVGVRLVAVLKSGALNGPAFDEGLFLVDLKSGRLLSQAAPFDRDGCPTPEQVEAVTAESDETVRFSSDCVVRVERHGSKYELVRVRPEVPEDESGATEALCGAMCQQNRMETCAGYLQAQGPVITDDDRRIIDADTQARALLELLQGAQHANAQWAAGERFIAEGAWLRIFRAYLSAGRPATTGANVELWESVLTAAGQPEGQLLHLGPRTRAEALNNLGYSLFRRGALRQARGAYLECQALLERSHETRPVLDLNLAELEKAQGNTAAARAAYQRFLSDSTISAAQRASATEALRSLQ